MSELNTEPPLAIEQVYADQRLPLVRLAYLLTGSSDGEPLDPTTIAGQEAVVFGSGDEFIAVWRDRDHGVGPGSRRRSPAAGSASGSTPRPAATRPPPSKRWTP